MHICVRLFPFHPRVVGSWTLEFVAVVEMVVCSVLRGNVFRGDSALIVGLVLGIRTIPYY